jgi:ankyrin repeat protein
MAKTADTAKMPPFRRVRIVGPDPKEAFKEVLGSPLPPQSLTIGDGKRSVTDKEIREQLEGRVTKDTQFDLLGHGTTSWWGSHHVIHLRNTWGQLPYLDYTSTILTLLDSTTDDPLQIYIDSCRSGAANASFEKYLKKPGSVLVTTSEPDYNSLESPFNSVDLPEGASPEEKFLWCIRRASQTITFNMVLENGEVFKYTYRPFRNRAIAETETVQDLIAWAEQDFIKAYEEATSKQLRYPLARERSTMGDMVAAPLLGPSPPERVTEREAKAMLTKHLEYLIRIDKLVEDEATLKLITMQKDRATKSLFYYALFPEVKPHAVKVLQQAAVVSTEVDGGKELLFEAVETDNLKALDILLKDGVDPEVQWGRKSSFLHALERGHLKVFDALLKARGDKPSGTQQPIDTRLLSCALKTNLKAFEALVEIAKTEQTAIRGSVFFYALQTNPEALEILLKTNGGNPDLQDSKGNPIMHEALDKNPKALKVLLEAGGNPDTLSRLKYPMLYYTLFPELKDESFRALLKAKADPNVRDPKGNPMLYYALRLQNPSVLNSMLEAEKKANPNILDKDGKPILCHTLWPEAPPGAKANLKAFSALLDAGATPLSKSDPSLKKLTAEQWTQYEEAYGIWQQQRPHQAKLQARRQEAAKAPPSPRLTR